MDWFGWRLSRIQRRTKAPPSVPEAILQNWASAFRNTRMTSIKAG
jgi:hypothetical protein